LPGRGLLVGKHTRVAGHAFPPGGVGPGIAERAGVGVGQGG